MNVIVCVKHVPQSMKFDPVTKSILREQVDSEINPFDLFAIEETIRLHERTGAATIAVCMGVTGAEQSLRKAIAMGIGHAILLTDKRFAGSDTYVTSSILSAGIKSIGDFGLIICGKQSTDGDTAQVGVQIAQKLGLPFITNVVQIDKLTDNFILCKRLVEYGYELVESTIPALITVCKGINEPRIPTIKNLIRAETANITKWSIDNMNLTADECGSKGSPTRVLKTYTPDVPSYNCKEIVGSISHQVDCLIELFRSAKDTEESV